VNASPADKLCKLVNLAKARHEPVSQDVSVMHPLYWPDASFFFTMSKPISPQRFRVMEPNLAL